MGVVSDNAWRPVAVGASDPVIRHEKERRSNAENTDDKTFNLACEVPQ